MPGFNEKMVFQKSFSITIKIISVLYETVIIMKTNKKVIKKVTKAHRF